MIQINEWLPNPIGKDSGGEWIELTNNGKTPATLAGWKVAETASRAYSLPAKTIAPGGYLVVGAKDLKITLRNTQGELALYDPSGTRVDQASFPGSAPENKSWARTSAGFAWQSPSPGLSNEIAPATMVTDGYPAGVPIDKPVFRFAPLGLGFAASLAISFVILFAIRKNENLQELFFGRY